MTQKNHRNMLTTSVTVSWCCTSVLKRAGNSVLDLKKKPSNQTKPKLANFSLIYGTYFTCPPGKHPLKKLKLLPVTSKQVNPISSPATLAIGRF